MAASGVAFALTLGLVFLEEFADKTQLILLALVARGHRWRVWAGAVMAFTLLTVAAALAGDLVARWVPAWAVRVAAGLLFIAFGAGSLLRPEAPETPRRAPGFAVAFVLILVAEMGDKTQLAVAALAAETGQTLAVILGGVLALALAALVPVLVGPWLVRRVSMERMERIGAWVFIGLGALVLGSLALPWTRP